jgi:predicted nucleic acid-binding protein
MLFDPVFLDTSYVIALLNSKDQYHKNAKRLQQLVVRQPKKVWTTEAVLIEIGNSLTGIHRGQAVSFINLCYKTPNLKVINVSTSLLNKGIELYASHHDKTWGLTDCISFVVMYENRILYALTADKHFEQAGFRAMLRD